MATNSCYSAASGFLRFFSNSDTFNVAAAQERYSKIKKRNEVGILKNVSKILLVPITLGCLSSISPTLTYADSVSNSAVTEQALDNSFSTLNQDNIVVGENDNNATVTENYLTVEDELQNSLLRAAPKSIKVSGTMVFDKQGWGYGPPKSRNWKEKRNGYWYYGKLYLKSYKSSGNLWIAQYSGILTR